MTSKETSSSARTPGKDLLTCFNARADAPAGRFSEKGEVCCAMRGSREERRSPFILMGSGSQMSSRSGRGFTARRGHRERIHHRGTEPTKLRKDRGNWV